MYQQLDMGIRDRIKNRQSKKRKHYRKIKQNNEKLRKRFEKENWLVFYRGKLVKYSEVEKLEKERMDEIFGTEEIDFEAELDTLIRQHKNQIKNKARRKKT